MGGRAVSTDSTRLEEGQQQISAAGFVGIPRVNGMGSRTAVSACAGIVLNVGQETLLQQPAGRTIPDVAKPLRCRLRLHIWNIAKTPRPKSAIRSVFAVTPTETEGMQPWCWRSWSHRHRHRLRGYPSCAVRHRSTATQPILSECVMVHLCPPDAWTRPSAQCPRGSGRCGRNDQMNDSAVNDQH